MKVLAFQKEEKNGSLWELESQEDGKDGEIQESEPTKLCIT